MAAAKSLSTITLDKSVGLHNSVNEPEGPPVKKSPALNGV